MGRYRGLGKRRHREGGVGAARLAVPVTAIAVMRGVERSRVEIFCSGQTTEES